MNCKIPVKTKTGLLYVIHNNMGYPEFRIKPASDAFACRRAPRVSAPLRSAQNARPPDELRPFDHHLGDDGCAFGNAVDGQMAGTSGLSKRLEGINIVLVPKSGKAPDNTAHPNVVGDGGKLPDNPYKG